MQPQLLKISPEEFIIFRGTILQGNVFTAVNFHNPLDQNLYFKIKTTKPERYCVSPNLGIIPNNNTISIAIKLKEVGVPPEEISKDKFLVQSILSENVAKGVDAETAFRRVKNANLMETKLKVKAEVDDQEYHTTDEDKDSNSFKSAKLPPLTKLANHTTNSIDISDVMMPRCDPSGRTDDFSREIERESTLKFWQRGSNTIGDDMKSLQRGSNTLGDDTVDKESNPITKFGHSGSKILSDETKFGQGGSRILSDIRLGGLFQKNIMDRLVTNDSKIDTIRFNFTDRNERSDNHIRCLIGSLILGMLCFILGYYFQNIWSNHLTEKYLSNC